jgi:hypothetical protein
MNSSEYLSKKQEIARYISTDDGENIFNFVQNLIVDAYNDFVTTSTFTIDNEEFYVAALDAGVNIVINFADEQLSWQEFDLLVMGMIAQSNGAIDSFWKVLA